jgi:hypothetical protein
MTIENIKTKLNELASEIVKETLNYKAKPSFRKIEFFYMDLDSIFKPIGFGYPEGEEEFEYDNIRFEIGKMVSEKSIYSEVYSLIKEVYTDKFKVDEENNNVVFDSLESLLYSYKNLLIRNVLHFDPQYNYYMDYLGYKNHTDKSKKTYETFVEEYKTIKSEEIIKNANSFMNQMIEKFNQVLINDLKDVPPVYLNKIFGAGIELKEDEYKISENIVIRRIKFSDEFNSYRKNSNRLKSFLLNHPTFIIEFKSDSTNISVFSKSLKGLKNTKEIILDSLKLYTLNGFQIIHEIEYPSSIEKQYFSENKTHKENLKRFPMLPPKETGIQFSRFNDEDAKNLAKIIELVQYISQSNNSDTDFIRISLDFFMEALSKNILSGTVTYSILSLEALYNTSNTEVTKNLRDKCSFLLSICRDLDIQKHNKFIKKLIKKDLGSGYAVRSTYVHGEDPNKFNDYILTQNIKKYTYYSLLIFMQLIHFEEVNSIKENLMSEYKSQKKTINDFIIYNSLINNDYLEKLKDLIGKCNLFDSYSIFRT